MSAAGMADGDGRGMWRPLAAWLPAVLWMAVIYRFSSFPGSQVPGRFGNLAHVVEYAVLGALLFLPASRLVPLVRAAAFAIVLSSLYGITDEFHQAFVPGRVPDATDWARDTLGAAIAVALLAWWAARRKKAARKGRPS